jgi:hypothetical protein
MARTRILRRVLELKYEGKRHMGKPQTRQQIRQQKVSGTIKKIKIGRLWKDRRDRGFLSPDLYKIEIKTEQEMFL